MKQTNFSCCKYGLFSSNLSKLNSIFYLHVLIIFLSCSEKHSEIKNQTNTGVSDTAKAEIKQEVLSPEKVTDIYTIEKKEVVFFLINKKEMKDLMHEIGDSYRWETEALFNNFINQANTFQGLLKKHNIKCAISNSKQFEIKLKNGKNISFNRLEKDQIMGEIISDGDQQPLIEFGMYNNSELAKLIEGFYRIENLGYVQPDSTLITQEPETSP